MRLASRPVGDRFFPRFCTPSSIAQINVPFITESTNPRQRACEYINQATSTYRKAAQYRPYPRTSVDEERSIFRFFFPSRRALLLNTQGSLPAFHSNAYRRSAPLLLYRITPLVSARCPVCTHSFFFSRTLRRCRSQYLKANGIKERYPQVVYIFFKPHTYSPSLSEENIHQTTRPRKVARPLPV